MEILKINTGIYNLLLVEVPTEVVLDYELDKKNKTITVKYDDEQFEIDLSQYLDEESREIKVLGLWALMREQQFRSLLVANNTNSVKLYFTKEFDTLLSNEGWTKSIWNTLILRI